MKRNRLSTLMLWIVIVALATTLVMQARQADSRKPTPSQNGSAHISLRQGT